MNLEETRFRSLPREYRRSRIVKAAKQVLLEKGWDATNMDEVAARAGTTKPTVYAHFSSKDELFAAVADLVKGLLSGELQGPEVYADEPVEAVTLFCARYLELISWRDGIALQRAALTAANRSLAMARAVYDAVFGEAERSLTAYLQARELVPNAEQHATLLLSAATDGVLRRHLFGIDDSPVGLPDPKAIGARVDLNRIRQAVTLLSSVWNVPRG